MEDRLNRTVEAIITVIEDQRLYAIVKDGEIVEVYPFDMDLIQASGSEVPANSEYTMAIVEIQNGLVKKVIPRGALVAREEPEPPHERFWSRIESAFLRGVRYAGYTAARWNSSLPAQNEKHLPDKK